jgi:hypothetical protein
VCRDNFRAINEEIELKPDPGLPDRAASARSDLQQGDRDAVPEIVGAVSVAFARSFTIIDPDLKNSQTKQWSARSTL